MNAAVLRALRKAGFSPQVASALAHSGIVGNVEDLRSLPWGDEKPLDGGLGWRLMTQTRLGPKGINEVKAFRGERHWPVRRSERGVMVLNLPDEFASYLDELIERQPSPRPSREDMVISILRAAMEGSPTPRADDGMGQDSGLPVGDLAGVSQDPASTVNQRKSKRAPATIPAVLFDDAGDAVDAVIVDRSRSGVRVSCLDKDARQRACYVLRLDTGFAYCVRLVWAEGEMAGYRLTARTEYSAGSLDPAIRSIGETWARYRRDRGGSA